MKKLGLFIFTMQIACAFVQTYAAEALPAETNDHPLPKKVFGEVDARLASLYLGTLSGYKDVGDIPTASRGLMSLSATELEMYRRYMFGKIFTFMDGVREKNSKDSASEKFNNLFEKIYKEAQDAAASELHKIDWIVLEATYMRALLLASGGGTEAAQDLLSTVPGMELFFGALDNTPPCLTKDSTPIPAWEHSSLAYILNSKDARGSDVFFPSTPTPFPLEHAIQKEVKKACRHCGLPKEVYVPMPGNGKIGLTTILKMWLNHTFPVPLTYKDYKAHGIELGAAVGAMHDKAHGLLDNRGKEVKKAVLNLLQPLPDAGKPARKAVPLASRHMVERYNAFNHLLLGFVEAKQRAAVSALSAATNTEEKKSARQQYNKGIVPLFQALHEAYAMEANVLEAPTFEGAMNFFLKNAMGEGSDASDQLNAFFNPASLTDEEVFDRG